jgi:hypothetical protein
MRTLMIQKLAYHLADFTPRLQSNNRAIYQYCPIPLITYPLLEAGLEKNPGLKKPAQWVFWGVFGFLGFFYFFYFIYIYICPEERVVFSVSRTLFGASRL